MARPGIVPFRREECGGVFAATQGGIRHSCGRLLCRKHLVIPVPKATRVLHPPPPELHDALRKTAFSRCVAAVLAAGFLSSSTFAQEARIPSSQSSVVVVVQRGQLQLQEDRPWPIFYIDTEGLMALYLDGRRIKPPVQGLVLPRWSPDGKWFAFWEGWQLVLMNLLGDRKTVVTTERKSLGAPLIWSPDGQSIAVVEAGDTPSSLTVTVIGVAKQKLQSRYQVPTKAEDLNPRSVNKFRWSPDSHKILFSTEVTVVVDTRTGVVETIAERPIFPEWGPKSDGVYYFELEGGPRHQEPADFYYRPLGAARPIRLMAKERIRNLLLTGQQGISFGLMTLSPKGSKLAIWRSLILTEDGSAKGAISAIHIYDLRDGRPLALNEPLQSFQSDEAITTLEWAPDENSLAAVALSDQEGTRIRVLDLQTQEWRTLVKVGERGNSGLGFIYAIGAKTMTWTGE